MQLTVFLGLMSVKSGTASQIVNDLDALLTNSGITDWKNKMIGFGSDGASVNVGSEAEVAALLKQDIPYLISIHCVAHKLELATLDACKEVTYVGNFQDTVKELVKFYSRSSKRLGELADAGALLNSTIKKFGKWNPIRWIASKNRIIKALEANWSAITLHLEQKAAANNTKEANQAKGLLKKTYLHNIYCFLRFYE